MSYNPITENLSFNYQELAITSDITLTTWGKQLYDIIAGSGNITITLPPNPIGTNLLETGSIFFRRLDTVAANNVIIVAEINGVMQNIRIPIGTDVVHWFVSVFDGSLGSTAFYFQENSANVLNQSRVAKELVETLSEVNLDVNATNYIGLTIGGYYITIGTNILFNGQNNTAENGVYVVQSNGGVSRRYDFKQGINVSGYIISVAGGVNNNKLYLVRNTANREHPATAGYDGISASEYLTGRDIFADYGFNPFVSVTNSNYSMNELDTCIISELVGGVDRSITLASLSAMYNPLTAGKTKTCQIIKLGTGGVLTINCSGGDTFADGTTATTLQKNGDNIILTGIPTILPYIWIIG